MAKLFQNRDQVSEIQSGRPIVTAIHALNDLSAHTSSARMHANAHASSEIFLHIVETGIPKQNFRGVGLHRLS